VRWTVGLSDWVVKGNGVVSKHSTSSSIDAALGGNGGWALSSEGQRGRVSTCDNYRGGAGVGGSRRRSGAADRSVSVKNGAVSFGEG